MKMINVVFCQLLLMHKLSLITFHSEDSYCGGGKLTGQVHGSAHAHLSKCFFSARTCCIIYASNTIMS